MNKLFVPFEELQKMGRKQRQEIMRYRRRFWGSIAMILILIPILVAFAGAGEKKGEIFNGVRLPHGYTVEKVTILEGDRAWNIQESLTPNMDTRKALTYFSKLNGTSPGKLIPFKTYFFLKEVE